MSDQEKWQQKFMEFKQLQEHIEQLTEHVQRLHEATQEIEETKSSLIELTDVKEGSELLAPIANGIFVQATINQVSTLRVNVGAQTVVEKSVPQVLEMLSIQQKDIAHKVVEAEEILQGFHKEAMKIYKEVESAKE